MAKPEQPRELSLSRSGRATVPETEIGKVAADGRRVPPSGRIVIRPAIPEWQESADDYEEFIDALAERGVDVELAEIKGIPSGADLAAHFVPEAFAIHVGVKATDILVEKIMTEAMRVIVERAKARWWRKGEEVKGTIYGPDGQILKEVVWRSKEGRDPGPTDRTAEVRDGREDQG